MCDRRRIGVGIAIRNYEPEQESDVQHNERHECSEKRVNLVSNVRVRN